MVDVAGVWVPVRGALTEYFTDGEFVCVIYEAETGALHRLNSGAAAVWSTLDETRTIKDVVDELADYFEISRVDLEVDVVRALEQLAEVNLAQLLPG